VPFTIYQLKPKFQALLRPLSGALHRGGITANMVTLAAAFGSAAYGAWMALAGSLWPFLLLPLALLVRMALNAIDGMLAREHDQQSKLGAVLNELGDVVSDAALYTPFVLLPGVRHELVAAVVFLAVLTEFAGVLGQVVGAGRRYDGPFGKSDRAFAFGALGLLAGAGAPVLAWFDAVLGVMLALLAWTIWNRVQQAIG
jgi:CDP-diacylglycerol--glycerol-3-phosphate 3-phosphatidyltransferase